MSAILEPTPDPGPWYDHVNRSSHAFLRGVYEERCRQLCDALSLVLPIATEFAERIGSPAFICTVRDAQDTLARCREST
jgi:hypothetical protein